jgi:hypothetical protein
MVQQVFTFLLTLKTNKENKKMRSKTTKVPWSKTPLFGAAMNACAKWFRKK